MFKCNESLSARSFTTMFRVVAFSVGQAQKAGQVSAGLTIVYSLVQMAKTRLNYRSAFTACRELLGGVAVMACVISSFLLFAMPCAAQVVIGSASVMCGNATGSAGPIVGAIINQTHTTITDLEIELSIITRGENGILERKRDTRFEVVPFLSQTGMVSKLETNGDTYFSIPGAEYSDFTCPTTWDSAMVPNVAAIAITRLNGKSLLAVTKHGKPPKQAPLDTMLTVPRYTGSTPTQRDVIETTLKKSTLLSPDVINKQRQECASRGTWACTFNDDANIIVLISQP